jgi:hypothetical protein
VQVDTRPAGAAHGEKRRHHDQHGDEGVAPGQDEAQVGDRRRQDHMDHHLGGDPAAPGRSTGCDPAAHEDPGWREVDPRPDFPTWTDDYSNIVRVLATR